MELPKVTWDSTEIDIQKLDVAARSAATSSFLLVVRAIDRKLIALTTR
ncbi:MAG: hypothetical protein ACK5CR_18665 [Pseudanabaena sp.]